MFRSCQPHVPQPEVNMSPLLCTSRHFMKNAGRLGQRLAVLTFLMALMSMAGCGGDDDPPVITGEYGLSEVDGDELPTTADEFGPENTFTGGSMSLETDGEWT